MGPGRTQVPSLSCYLMVRVCLTLGTTKKREQPDSVIFEKVLAMRSKSISEAHRPYLTVFIFFKKRKESKGKEKTTSTHANCTLTVCLLR